MTGHQPRDHAVRCRRCFIPTWAPHAVCGACTPTTPGASCARCQPTT